MASSLPCTCIICIIRKGNFLKKRIQLYWHVHLPNRFTWFFSLCLCLWLSVLGHQCPTLPSTVIFALARVTEGQRPRVLLNAWTVLQEAEQESTLQLAEQQPWLWNYGSNGNRWEHPRKKSSRWRRRRCKDPGRRAEVSPHEGVMEWNHHGGKETFPAQQWLNKTAVPADQSERRRSDLSGSVSISPSGTN